MSIKIKIFIALLKLVNPIFDYLHLKLNAMVTAELVKVEKQEDDKKV